MTIKVHLFGKVQITSGSRAFSLPSSENVQVLFAYLLHNKNKVVSRSKLIGLFWPDLNEQRARHALSQALWQIRNFLSEVPGDLQDFILADMDSLEINPELKIWVDTAEFMAAFQASLQENTISSVTLQKCVEQYRGEFLEGCYTDWVLAEREHYQELYLMALSRLVREFKQQGHYEKALLHARRITKQAPWLEEAHREVIQLYYLLGEPYQALNYFEVCQDILVDEIGQGPLPDTFALIEQINQQIDHKQPPILPTGANKKLSNFLERPDQIPLVGRKKELAALIGQIEDLSRGIGGMSFVFGEAGIGKSRLVNELKYNSEWRGIQASTGKCYELASPLAYQPVIEVLRGNM